MDWKYYRSHLQKPVRGKKKGELTFLFHKADVFKNLINDLSKPFLKVQFDKVACIDAMGFILGAAIASKLNKGLLPIRKSGSLALRKKDLAQITLVDYSGKRKTLELNKTAVSKGEKFILVDDWIETGSQIKAAIKLIEKAGGKVVGISCVGIDLKYDVKQLQKYKIVSVRQTAKDDWF
ncbi:hypothetical protein GF343_04890 [Candidatus Woesearchaeota archaeon]|nr:hypothetical protein [Candidatus Woesearchaeota archaeon]